MGRITYQSNRIFKGGNEMKQLIWMILLMIELTIEPTTIALNNTIDSVKDNTVSSIYKLPKNLTLEDYIKKEFYVLTSQKQYNKEVLENFIQGKTNQIYIVEYTDEGDPIISELTRKENQYHLITDTTQDRYGTQGYYVNTFNKMEVKKDYIVLKENTKESSTIEEKQFIRNYVYFILD